MNWHILDPQGNSMEVTEAQLTGIARAGQLTAATLVWREGMEEWLPAGTALPHLFNGAAPPPPPPPPRPVGPHPGARRPAAAPAPAQRKGGCLKWGLIGAGALVAMIVLATLFGGGGGSGSASGPGREALDAAEKLLKGSITGGHGDTEAEKKAASITAEIAKGLRDAGISNTRSSFGRGKSSLFRRAAAGMDADGFTCTCSVRGNVAVFLIHVPDLRKFADDAKEAMGHWAWAAARAGWSQLPEPRPARLAVGLRGIVLYDRLIEGAARPLEISDDADVTDALLKEGIERTETNASAAEKALAEHFAQPATLSTKAESPAKPSEPAR